MLIKSLETSDTAPLAAIDAQNYTRSDGRRAWRTGPGPSDRCDHVAERTRDLPPRLDLQPGENLLGVIAGGESADAEPPSDLRIRAPLGNQERDLRLSQG